MTELQSTILKVPVITFLKRLKMKRPDCSSLLATQNFAYHLKIYSPSACIKIRFQVNVKYCVFNNYIITILTPLWCHEGMFSVVLVEVHVRTMIDRMGSYQRNKHLTVIIID